MYTLYHTYTHSLYATNTRIHYIHVYTILFDTGDRAIRRVRPVPGRPLRDDEGPADAARQRPLTEVSI